jgi:outer membrane protein OmpA-like peptidoglycan-associated protein
MKRTFLVVIPVAMLALGASTACATKTFVRTSVGEVNNKVGSLGRSVEETQERTRTNEGRIAEVNQKAQAAAESAQQANSAAAVANGTATDAKHAASTVGDKFNTMDKASKRLVFEVVLSEDQGNFKFGKTTLPDEARARIDGLVQQLKQDPKNVYIEIEGHTDNIGPKPFNDRIGLERAEVVQRYLYEQYQIPLHKMSVISYGPEKPVAPNTTKAGRAHNRRVVIKILA